MMSLKISLAITATACLGGAYFGHQIGRRSVPVVQPAEVAPIQISSAPETGAPPKTEPEEFVARFASAIRGGDQKAAEAMASEFASLDRASVDVALDATLAIREPGPRRDALDLALSRLAELDPQAAIQFLAEQTPRPGRHNFTGSVFKTLAEKRGGAAAFALYKENMNLLEGQMGISSLFPIFHEWRTQDLDAALAAEKEVVGRGHRSQVVTTLSEAASRPEDREKVLGWARALANDGERVKALGTVARHWVWQESTEALLAWVDEAQLGRVEIGAIERAIAGVQLQDDPEAAAQWLMSRADDDSRPEHLAHLVQEWASRAPNAAGEWFAKQELDAGADMAISRFAQTITRDDPESAYEWAKQISDPGRRERTIESVMRYWNRFDPAAAKQARGGGG